MKKKLMLGNEAVARGVYESGAQVVSSYPGTPSTEITEYISGYSEIKSEWAPNEKVALETAIGASIMGSRAFSAMKHVGLNVAADPLFTVSYTGVNGGLVIAVADDPGMHSSQNEQDTRNLGYASKIPVLEPADSEECRLFTKTAFELSEECDTPVIIRLSTRISHTQTMTTTEDRAQIARKEYKKDPAKFVMMPGFARGRRLVVEKRMGELEEIAGSNRYNKIIDNNSEIGVITSGISYQYAREALGDKVSYLKLGMVYPLSKDLIADFCKDKDIVYVVEELDPFIENFCLQNDISVVGSKVLPRIGEMTAAAVREAILGEKFAFKTLDENMPMRPPVLCPGCPHRGAFHILSKLKYTVSGDIGCYTLGAGAPLFGIDSTICMGASVSALHGMNLSDSENANKRVAVIGDSTFAHSGITGLINAVYNNTNSTVIVLDNSITGMTGHQNNPLNGMNIIGEPASAINLEMLCESVGIKNVFVVDPCDLIEFEKTVKEATSLNAPSVIIARRPCVLLKSVKKYPPLIVKDCKNCKACMKIGCPAIKATEDGVNIDKSLCVGCGLCQKVCKFNAIREVR